MPAPLIFLFCLLPASAEAHGFGRTYTLPVPFWLYAWGCLGALLLSFVAVAWQAGRQVSTTPTAITPETSPSPGWQAVGLTLLLLTLVTALLGHADPYRNLSMTLFWVIFLLAGPWLAALFGDGYARLNPWRTLVDLLGAERWGTGRVHWPEARGPWPAVMLCLGLQAIELFGHSGPRGLGLLLLAYTLITCAGVWLLGRAGWFRDGDLFGILFRWMATLRPIWHEQRLRWPSATLPASNASLALLLVLLAGTAYDSLRDTVPWVQLFWADRTGLLTAWLGSAPVHHYALLRPWYTLWEWLWLLLSPLVLLGLLLACLALARRLAGSRDSLVALARHHAPSLLPVALAYQVAHYGSLVTGQGPRLLALLSDPFGRGWNLLGTAGWFAGPRLPDMTWLWHGQVIALLTGHVLGVVLSHRLAVQRFGAAGAWRAELPLLGLMMALTVGGLWLLSQPLTAG